MIPRKIATALLAAWLASTTGAGHAADPEFKVGLVTESRVLEREKASFSIGGIRGPSVTEWTSRVTITMDGVRITAEWVPKTTISASAKDFPRGSDVQAATTRSQLLLKHPDGSVVTAKIVQRVEPDRNDDRSERE
jgi:hypothetical protein